MEANSTNYSNLIREQGAFTPSETYLRLLELIEQKLLRQQSGNIVILGESGVGSTELGKMLVNRIVEGEIPEIPADTVVYKIDAASFAAGIKYVGTFEFKVKTLKEALKARPSILFIDNLHSLSGAGTTNRNNQDFFTLIQEELADGSIRVIGTSRPDDWERAMAGREDIASCFDTVNKDHPTTEQTVIMLENWISRYEYPQVPRELLTYIVELSNRLDPIGSQPRKAIKFLDEMFAHARRHNPQAKFDRKYIEQVTVLRYQIDPSEFDPEARRIRIGGLRAGLDRIVIGNDLIKDELVRLTKIAVTGLADQDKPRIRLLMGGDKGLAKTTLAFAYGEVMGLPVERIEMNNYDLHSLNKPEDLLRKIAKAVRKNPFAVIFLDEFEKASIDVQQSVLAAFDKGQFSVLENPHGGSNQSSVRVNVKKASFLLATNAGKDYLKSGRTFSEVDYRNFLAQDGISEFIIDRMQAVVPAMVPTKEQFTATLKLHLARIRKEISRAHPGLTIRINNVAKLLSQYTEAYHGESALIRPAIEALAKTVRETTADKILAGTVSGCVRLNIRKPTGIKSARVRVGFAQ